MKMGLRLACLAAAAGLGACAGAPVHTAANDDIDWAKVAQVNRHARDAGNYQVVWVNYPKKNRAQAGSQ